MPLFNRNNNFHLEDINRIPNKFSGWLIDETVDPKMFPTNGFYAALYFKFKNGKAIDAVLGIRGTAPMA
jgi:hypothetical protein